MSMFTNRSGACSEDTSLFLRHHGQIGVANLTDGHDCYRMEIDQPNVPPDFSAVFFSLSTFLDVRAKFTGMYGRPLQFGVRRVHSARNATSATACSMEFADLKWPPEDCAFRLGIDRGPRRRDSRGFLYVCYGVIFGHPGCS